MIFNIAHPQSVKHYKRPSLGTQIFSLDMSIANAKKELEFAIK